MFKRCIKVRKRLAITFYCACETIQTLESLDPFRVSEASRVERSPENCK
jgi:hypothetical protein